MPISTAEFITMQARLDRGKAVVKSVGESEINESSLHDKILSEIRARGWKAIHSRMDRRSTVEVGVCDFVIFADNGRVICCEIKTRSGKLTMEQNIFIAWLAKLGHQVHVVRDFASFIEIVK